MMHRFLVVVAILALACNVAAFSPVRFNARRLTQTKLNMAEGVTITAAMVSGLRQKTDAPMMECKKALTEANGDMSRAEEIIRVKLGNKASKVGGRIAAEGLVVIIIEGGKGVLFEANCETDFVSKNPDFIDFTKSCAAAIIAKNPADVSALSSLPMGDKTVEQTRSDLVGKIGENMSLRRFQRFEGSNKLASYLHGGSKIGVIVEYVGDDQAAKDVAVRATLCATLCATLLATLLATFLPYSISIPSNAPECTQNSYMTLPHLTNLYSQSSLPPTPSSSPLADAHRCQQAHRPHLQGRA
jgi:hypothetical protein